MRAARLLLLLAAAILPSAAFAQGTTATVNVASGKPTTIRRFFWCNGITSEVFVQGVQHGTVKTEWFKGEKCYKHDVPQVRFIYTSTPGYVGRDEAWLISAQGTRTLVRLNVR